MTKFHDPKVVLADGCQSLVFHFPAAFSDLPSRAAAFLKVLYVVGGVYM
jgi:hypothetical protein